MFDEQLDPAPGKTDEAVVIDFPVQRRDDFFDAYAQVHGLLLEGLRGS